jgi:hypothetical protein
LDPALGKYTLDRFPWSILEMKNDFPGKQEDSALKGDRDSSRPSMSNMWSSFSDQSRIGFVFGRSGENQSTLRRYTGSILAGIHIPRSQLHRQNP